MTSEFIAFSTGFCTHPSCMVLKGSSCLKQKKFPSRCYLIKTKNGYCLVDTGYAEHFFDATHGVYKLYPIVTPVTFDDTESAKSQILKLGIALSDIKYIIITHFHADHIAGLKDFPNAKFISSVEAWQSIQNLSGLKALKMGFLPDLLPKDISSRIEFMQSLDLVALPESLYPYTHGFQLSENIILVNLPGHAIGQIGVFIAKDNGWALLAADSAWTTENYIQLKGPSELSFIIQHKRFSYYMTLQKLNHLHNNGVEILLTHQE
jgi:glyoxylase-like metal-dependent hydrolase (beta-lactamase superfamily II)